MNTAISFKDIVTDNTYFSDAEDIEDASVCEDQSSRGWLSA